MPNYDLRARDKNNNLAPNLSYEGEVSVKQPGTVAWQAGVTTDENGNTVPVSGQAYLKKDDKVQVLRLRAGHLLKNITAIIAKPYDKNTTMKVTDSDGNVLFASLNASDTVCKTTNKALDKYIDKPLDITVEITAMAGDATVGQVVFVVDTVEVGIKTYMFG